MARNRKININKNNLSLGLGVGLAFFLMFLLVFRSLPLAIGVGGIFGIVSCKM